MAATVITHPAVERMAIRRQMATAVERLLDVVDVLMRELDSDAPDPDLEPSLGAPEYPAHLTINGSWRMPAGIFDWAKGASDDREADGDSSNAADADFEPSLGSLRGTAKASGTQRGWSGGDREDLEHEHDGREPQCKDEVAQCDDEGAIEYEMV